MLLQYAMTGRCAVYNIAILTSALANPPFFGNAVLQDAGGEEASIEAAAPGQPVDPAFDASWAAYEQDAAALQVVLGGVDAESKPISHTLVRGLPHANLYALK
jgi:hypothetical protein